MRDAGHAGGIDGSCVVDFELLSAEVSDRMAA
jgi:hypothetical protein